MNVVSASSLVVLQGMRYPEQGADPEGYRAYIDSAEAEFRRGVVH